MGSGYCENCMIRYSLSDKIWICCKYVDGNERRCNKKLNGEYNCDRIHDSSVYKFETGWELKFPYKKCRACDVDGQNIHNIFFIC